MDPSPDETVVVSGAAGGVGSLAVQLARRRGATVIGLASERNHAWLKDRGVLPVEYGPGVAERIRQASGGRVDAFIDTFGEGYVALAVELGVRPERMNTIRDWQAAAEDVQGHEPAVQRAGGWRDGRAAPRCGRCRQVVGLLAEQQENPCGFRFGRSDPIGQGLHV
ncbi:hypothetical protein [Streptomyces sp. NPDC088760]|uniref:hypothetical protein n=1 Tax=Streptomyces sp. NPDC088760 TaxID=3365890 RepID=UPI0038018BC7